MKVPVQLLSGEVLAELTVLPLTTVREFKRQVQELQPYKDEVTRRVSLVDVLLGDRKLLNDHETVEQAGLFADVAVRVLFRVAEAVECVSSSEAGLRGEPLLIVKIPDNARMISSRAFAGCKSLLEVTIPDSVVAIRSFAFAGCRSLLSLRIPESVTTIEHGAFYGCSSLTLTIPSSWADRSCSFKGCHRILVRPDTDADPDLRAMPAENENDACHAHGRFALRVGTVRRPRVFFCHFGSLASRFLGLGHPRPFETKTGFIPHD